MTIQTDTPSLMIAAPASGSGKTTVTLALLRAFRNKGVQVTSFKTGPDYIDPVFHHHASGHPCQNLDPWGMQNTTLDYTLHDIGKHAELVIGEGVMGLFDGARDGTGSTADLAAQYQIPIILVMTAKGQAASAGAVLHGFNQFRKNTKIAGVIFNQVSSPAHGEFLKKAAEDLDIPCLGLIPKKDHLALPSRHLGLVQAGEMPELESFLEEAAELITTSVDLDSLQSFASIPKISSNEDAIGPLFQASHIAIAKDAAFTFIYPHLLKRSGKAGQHITYFSPLADEAPDPRTDFIYLPGGYPELHLEALAKAHHFREALQTAKKKSIPIFGECGGYMVMGQEIIGKDGLAYPMTGLLSHRTSFETPKIHLGYRKLRLLKDSPFGSVGQKLRAHEFHYASELIDELKTTPLFSVTDANGVSKGSVGECDGSAFGSFLHLIDQEALNEQEA
ncbi:cobyrinate a,c-diamide synthase [Sneathiella limimaris]|uniref:cobyrinate a,c-diamide synthase n=1 Tax=Sneathiella limimaris TaxID=1964213 RepID=UPI0019D0B158|nr:cobyrinate a,c-diamide synthase [Sneathiella limimaris]